MVDPIDGAFPVIARRDHMPFLVGAKAEQHHKQEYRSNSVVDFFLAHLKENPTEVTQEQVSFYSDIDKVLEENSEFIEQHLDRRIQLFFMQLISVYRMPYHFEWVEAQDEYGKGGNYNLKNGKEKVRFQTEAAHPSTLPSLEAYPRDEWEEYKAGRREKPKGFVYLKYGHSYMQHNATLELTRCVNRADCLIDGTHKDSKLRNEVIKIVNDVAAGKYGPRVGTKRFMERLKRFVEQELAKRDDHDPRAKVLERYLERVEDVFPLVEQDDGYFDNLVGVKLQHQREEALRKVVYQKRFKLIQECEGIESKIARSILDAQNKMLKTDRKSLKSVDYRIRYILLEERDPRLKRVLERLFCTSLDQLQVGIERNEERLRNFEHREKITSFRQSQNVEMQKLKRVLKRHFLELDNAELDYRSHLFKGLRGELNQWYQPDFVRHYQEKYDDSMSQSMVSRMEQRTRNSDGDYVTPLSQRRKDIGEKKALRIANVYGVDPGLFLPGVLSSMY